MERIVSFAKTEDSSGIYALFYQTAKDNTESLYEKISALMQFFNENVRS
ncbi:MAG TPA: hypothetical protein IAB62_06815 [Candidatus Coprocola pullicola]|nr:hypothetical protein [Candidatus Coprocola pullicola]